LEDDLNKKNGRRPQKHEKFEEDIKKIIKDSQKKRMTTSKKIKIMIPLKFRGNPFLGLAQLSTIFIYNIVGRGNYAPLLTRFLELLF
jgi:hypothetical protein